ncbi:Lcl C-terminal domain-containing protein [Thiomicrospira microaerophila]|uniref:Lcl C-terminal domain-containing protein n=1 Tax=Thiomicrospira microaerophila TaxID=406020 RepID=UPI0005C8C257|nr:DUF1566 domain-containing protein [Thiomicrospira microaerophila]
MTFKLKKSSQMVLTCLFSLSLAGCSGGGGGSDSQRSDTSASDTSASDTSASDTSASDTSVLFRPVKLNDTGITWGGNFSSGNNLNCTGETIEQQDCSHGRDAHAAAGSLSKIGGGHAGFDFTRLNADGSTYTGNGIYTQAPWACVKDNHTGLIWEVKTPARSGGIHDANNSYRWGGKTALLTGEFGIRYNDWYVLVDGSNNKKLCGFNDWRVPSQEELLSIVNYGRASPAIDQSVFPNTQLNWYWSASPFAISSDYAWGINFRDGDSHYGYRDFGYPVRLVRSGQ